MLSNQRGLPSFKYEEELMELGLLLIAGIDEAGLSPLAGPSSAAAVIFQNKPKIKGINDSKKLTPEQREGLFPQIIDEALTYGVGLASVDEIDNLNIYHANHLAMQRAIAKLSPQPSHLLIDGKTFHSISKIPATWIVKGDTLSLSIAAASILAKVTRDRIMCKLAEEYPEYMWQQNKGYPTKLHRESIATYGITKHHRSRFVSKLSGGNKEYDG